LPRKPETEAEKDLKTQCNPVYSRIRVRLGRGFGHLGFG
jgi:hypothetical protein